MSRQAADELYIELGYYTPENYYVYTARAQVFSGFYIDDDYIDPDYFESSSVFATLTCELTKQIIVLVDAALSGAFAQVATAGLVHDVTITVDALFTPSFGVEAILNSTAILDSVADLTSTASKFTGYESLLDFFAALNAQAARTRLNDSVVSAQFDTVITAARLRDSEFSLAVVASVTAAVVCVRTAVGSLTSTVAVAVDAELIVLSDVIAVSSSAQLTARLQNQLERPFEVTSSNLRFDTDPVRFGTHSAFAVESSSEHKLARFELPDASIVARRFTYNTTNQMAVDLQVYFTANAGQTDIISVRDRTANQPLWTLGNNGGSVNISHFDGSFFRNTQSLNANGSVNTAVFFIEVWHHVRLLFDPGVGIAIYVDGLRLALNTTNIQTPTAVTAATLTIGANTAGGDQTSFNIDELRIQSSPTLFADQNHSVAATTISTPTAAFVSNEATSILLHFDNTLLDDTIGIVNAESVVQAVFALNANASLNLNSSSSLAAAAALAVNLDIIKNISAAASANTVLAVTVQRIVDFVISVDSALAFAIDADLVLKADVEFESAVVMAVVAERIRFGHVAINSSATTTTTVSKFLNADSAMSAVFAQTTAAVRQRNTAAGLSTNAAVVIVTQVIYTPSFFATSVLDTQRLPVGGDVTVAFTTSILTVSDALTNAVYAASARTTIFGNINPVIRVHDVIVTKFKGNGKIEWSRVYNNLMSNFNNFGVVDLIQGADSIFVAVRQVNTNNSSTSSKLLSVSSHDGTVNYLRGLNSSIDNLIYHQDHLYVFSDKPGPETGIVKLNAVTGATVVVKGYRDSAFNADGFNSKLAVTDSNWFFCMQRAGSSGILVVKLSTAGNINLSQQFNLSNRTVRDFIAAADGTLYLLTTAGLNTQVFAFDANFGVIYATQLNFAVTGNNSVQFCVDDTNNVLISAQNTVLKINATGNLIYARRNTFANSAIDSTTEFTQVVTSEIKLAQTFADGSNTRFTAEDFDYDILQIPQQSNLAVTFDAVSTVEQFNQLDFASIESLASEPSLVSVEYLFRVVFADLSISSNAELAATGTRVRRFTVDTETTLQLTAAITVIRTATAALTISSSVASILSRTRPAAATLAANTSVICIGTRIRIAALTALTAFAQVTAAQRSRTTAAQLSATANITVAFVRTRDVATELDSIATQLTAVVKVGVFLIALDSSSNLTAAAEKNVNIPVNLQVNTQLNSVATTVLTATADFTAETAVTATILRIQQSLVALASTAVQTAQANKTLGISVALDSAAILQAQSIRVRFAAAALNITTALDCVNQVILNAEAILSAEFVDLFIVTRIQRVQAQLTALAFAITVGRVINIDPLRQLRVPREHRQLQVKQETRTKRVQSETRTLVI